MQKMKFLKGDKLLFLLVLILTTIICIPLLSDYLYRGDDLSFHLHRLEAIADCLRGGQLLPRVYPYTNFGYGYATPLFYCDLLLYPFAMLLFIDVPTIISYKIMIAFYTFLNLLFVLLCSKKIFKNNLNVAVILCVVTFIPTRFIDMYFRAALGQYIAFCFLPLVVYSIYRLLTKCDKYNFIYVAFSFSFIMLSHNITMLLICVCFAIFLLLFFVFSNSKQKKYIFIQLTLATFLALLITAFFLLPMFEQYFAQRLRVHYSTLHMDLQSTAVSLLEMLNPQFYFSDTSSGPLISKYGLSPLIILLPFLLLHKKIKMGNINKIIFSLFLLFLILSTNAIDLSRWIPQLNIIQYSFRFFIILSLLFVIAVGIIIKHFSNNKLNVIIVLLSVLYILPAFNILLNSSKAIPNDIIYEEYFNDEHTYKEGYNSYQTLYAEYLPDSVVVDYIDGSRAIRSVDEWEIYDVTYEYERNFNKIEFEYASEGNEYLMVPLTWYKGYTVKIIDEQGKEYINNTVKDVNYDLVKFKTMRGNNHYIIDYTGTLTQTISLLVSLIVIIASILTLCRSKRYKSLNNQ